MLLGASVALTSHGGQVHPVMIEN